MASWCPKCRSHKPTERSETGLICCTGCGTGLGEDNFSNEPTFCKDAGGRSQFTGNFVNSIADDSASRQRTLNNAEDTITRIAVYLELDTGRHVREALSFYKIALNHNFTRGRNSEQVAAACLYIACRAKSLPFFLIEFSEHLGVNVYELGHVYLQLCKILHLDQHPTVSKLVDPSLFMRKLTKDLLCGGRRNRDDMDHDRFKDEIRMVEKTALMILTSMKRNWMQTGRKPSGICGAALYISALSHGLNFSKTDVIKVIHTCEATLSKRLVEFEDTQSANLNLEEFEAAESELEKGRKSSSRSYHSNNISSSGELLCAHKDSPGGVAAHGLCQSCYEEFMTISGGLEGELEPPAFQRAERERLAKKACDNESAAMNILPTSDFGDGTAGEERSTLVAAISCNNDYEGTKVPSSLCDDNKEDIAESGGDESDLSYMDDPELDANIITDEEEIHLKEKSWMLLYPDYDKEQKAKEASNAAKSKRVPKAKRNTSTEQNNPQTSAEAAYQMMATKRLSSKVNYEALEKLFGDSLEASSVSPKRPRNMDSPGPGPGPEYESYDDEMPNASEQQQYEGYNLW
ncbi:hypothetical protein Dimus_028387 [Dionaea muscipula]